MMPSVSIFLLWLLGSSEGEEFRRSRPNIEQKNFWEFSEKGSYISISAELSPGSVSVGQEAIIICSTDCPGHVYLKQNGLFIRSGWIWNRRYEFYIHNVKSKDGGVYTCCCNTDHSFSNYETRIKCSEPVELLIIDSALPKPNISLIPRRMAVLGSQVTIQCWPRDQNGNIYLQKTGARLKPQAMEADGETSVFHIKDVSPSDGGEYYCWNRREFLVSHPSDAEELWLLDTSLTKPRITLTPAVVSLGGKATIKCQSDSWVYNFYLQKPRDPKLLKLSADGRKGAQFTIWKVSKEDIGSYICMYTSSLSPHSVLSLPSDPVALLLQVDIPTVIAIGAGVAVLVLFLGLGAFLWYKRRKVGKRQSTAPISGEPSFKMMKVHWKATSDGITVNESGQQKDLPPEQDSTAETQSVIYAELKYKAPPVQSDEDSADDSDGCIYTTVVLH